MTLREESDSPAPVFYYACSALEDWEALGAGPPIRDERSSCDGCGRVTIFDPDSYRLAQTLGQEVRIMCQRCLQRELVPDYFRR